LRAVSSQARWIQSKAAASLNPAQVERALSEIASRWNGSLQEWLRGFALGENALIHLLAVSTICAERLRRDPELLRWLAQPKISASDRGYRRMQAELQASAASIPEHNFRTLRTWKAREMTRIALREVAEAASLEETTAELSQLAEVCLGAVYDHALVQLRARIGAPATEFCALGLGKLGGLELNHSSDIDLIFLYGTEGAVSPGISYHEWHNRLAESIIKFFATSDPAGALFRIDLRLRPEGATGPLTRSLESVENYYAGFGEMWERLALIKARRVCGSEELAYEFLRQHQPFIFPRTPTPELLDEIAALKRRIEREIPADDFNVKLGVGGIREIEFVVQTLQFIHGARHAFLQETSTLKALRALAQLELLPIADVRALDHAYRLLRRVEHRLQIDAERQTHSIPTDPAKRERLARSLGFPGTDAFLAELRQTMTSVREIFVRVVASEGGAPAVNLGIFNNPARAERALHELAQGSSSFHVAPRTRQIFRKLRPLLLEELAGGVDPDQTLVGVVRFVEAFGLRSLLFELLAANPKLLQLLVRTFDASEFATQLLVKNPQLLEEITRSGTIDQPRSMAQHEQALRDSIESRHLDGIRAYRQTQLLRATIRDVLGLADLPTLCREQTDLAEACLLAANAVVGSAELTIVAMGKFGGRELGYGADVDLMFVGHDHRAAQNLVSALSAPSLHGVIAPVDVRLRPEGEKGPLVSSIEAFANYYRDRAQLWEIQALTRARAITGALHAEFHAVAHAAWSIAGRDPKLFAKINEMLERIRRERGSGSDFLDFKTGAGGIVEAEFLVQGLQMRHDVREASMLGAIHKLAGIISRREINQLQRAYGFLRRCELVLRRLRNASVSVLPSDKIAQRQLARRLGFDDYDAWQLEYERARTDVHALYEKHVASQGDRLMTGDESGQRA
jgi:glutamate-ammonia-ligase adenylyltransferase